MSWYREKSNSHDLSIQWNEGQGYEVDQQTSECQSVGAVDFLRCDNRDQKEAQMLHLVQPRLLSGRTRHFRNRLVGQSRCNPLYKLLN